MIQNIRVAFNEILDENEWMDEDTKKVAKEKANAMNERIGYPDFLTNAMELSKEYHQVTCSFSSSIKLILFDRESIVCVSFEFASETCSDGLFQSHIVTRSDLLSLLSRSLPVDRPQCKPTLTHLRSGRRRFVVAQLQVYEEQFLLNAINLMKFESFKNLQRLREPVDKDRWLTDPAVVNAFYNPNKNDIVFPAGILQPFFYSSIFPK
jgi:hypothetical protein